MNQSLVDEIVSNVLAQLQPLAARPVHQKETPKLVEQATAPAVAVAAELTSAVITAGMLEEAVRPGQALRVGRNSILTPSARDWLHSKRVAWSRQERVVGTKNVGASKARWRIMLQTVTPTVKALQEGLRRTSDGWKVDVVGQPLEAVALATNLICAAENDGIVIFTEQADLIACFANRNERVRAAVMQNSKQWELVTRTLGANIVCINPVGRTFMELRNLLKECVRT